MFNSSAKKKIITVLLATSLMTASLFPSFSAELQPDGDVGIVYLSEKQEINENSEINEEPVETTEVPGASSESDIGEVSASANNVSENRVDNENYEGNIEEDDHIEEMRRPHLLRAASLGSNLLSTSGDSFYVTGASGKGGDGTPDISSSWLRFQRQRKSGICWIFAANNALQANIYKNGGIATNISEKSTAYYYWNSPTDRSEGHALSNAHNELVEPPAGYSNIPTNKKYYGIGGRTKDLDGYFAAWKGLVPDTGKDSFGTSQLEVSNTSTLYGSSENMQTPDADRVYSNEIGHVQDIYHCDAGDRDTMKNLVRTYGAAAISVDSDSASKRNSYPAWYKVTTSETNHAVTVIGWDDNYPKTNFPGNGPANNGAWYCMDSAGQSVQGVNDINGCFWLSYEDAALTDPQGVLDNVATAYHVVSPSAENFYNHNYIGGAGGYCSEPRVDTGTDPHGICYKAEGQNNSTGHEKVQAIGFSTFEPNTQWVIKAYRGTHAEEANLMSSQTESIEYAGFHTIELDSPFLVDTNGYFYVEITPTESASVEYVVPGPNSSALSPLHRFINEETDSTTYFGDYDAKSYFGNKYGTSYINGVETPDKQVMIHAYTFDALASGTVSRIAAKDINITYGDADVAFDDYCDFTPGQNDTGTHVDTIASVLSSNTNSIVVKADRSLEIKDAGTSKLTITTADGIQQDIWITVNPYEIQDSDVSSIGTYTSSTFPATPNPYVRVNGQLLSCNSGYVLSYENNWWAGTACVTVTGIGNYCGEVRQEFTFRTARVSAFEVPSESINVTAGDTEDIFDHVVFHAGSELDGTIYGISEVKVKTSTGNVTENEYARIAGDNVTFKRAGTVQIMVKSEDNVSAIVTFTVTGGTSTPGTPTTPEGNENENNNPGTPSTPTTPTEPAGPSASESNERETNVPSASESNNGKDDNDFYDESTKTLIKVADDQKYVKLGSGSNSLVIVMRKEIPYTRNKSAIVSAVGASLTMLEGSGISIKSVKAKKPKKNASSTTVTIKLKGSTKETKKAVKSLNRSLKNISITLKTTTSSSSTDKK